MALSVVIGQSAAGYAAMGSGKWKLHSAYDNDPVRIIDTENKTYFIVLQQMFNGSLASFKVHHQTVLLCDKQKDASRIIPLGQVNELQQDRILLTDYNPIGKYLILLYEGGKVDLIYDNGEQTTLELPMTGLPGSLNYNYLTYYDKQTWVATGDGFVVIDGESRTVQKSARLNQSIDCVGRIDDYVILFTSNTAFYAPANPMPQNWSDFSLLMVPSGSLPAAQQNGSMLTEPRVLMPLQGNKFAYVGPAANTSQASINYVWHENGGWKAASKDNCTITRVGVNNIITQRYERNFIPNRDGYMFFTSAGLIGQIDRNVDVSNLPAQTYSKTGRTPVVAGSWDMSKVWVSVDRGKFQLSDNLSGDTYAWSGEAIRPEVPAVMQSMSMAYSPTQGSVVLNFGYQPPLFESSGFNRPPLTSALRDGKWSLPNNAYYPPEFSTEAQYKTLYDKYKVHFPSADPTGMSIDPLNPDFAFYGSMYTGLTVVNLANPSQTPIRLGSPSDPLATLPGFKAVLPLLSRDINWGPLATPSFDNNGVMWSYSYDKGGYEEGGPMLRLKYWRPANRNWVLRSNNVDNLDEIGDIPVPETSGLQRIMLIDALKHQLNKNRLVFYEGSKRRIHVYNHGGTLGDYTDDSHNIIKYIYDQNTSQYVLEYVDVIAEDPITGYVWVSEQNNLLSFNPRLPVYNNTVNGRTLDVSYGGTHGNPVSYIKVNGIAFDNQNRMWLSTRQNGVWVISADRKEALAHYTIDNSGLPSDMTYAMVWNPDTQSMLISTDAGIAEVWPDLDAEFTADAVRVWPKAVAPDYAGQVSIMNLPPNSLVSVRDNAGKEINRLFADPEGRAVWNLQDADSRQIDSGKYTISSDAAIFPDVEISVLR